MAKMDDYNKVELTNEEMYKEMVEASRIPPRKCSRCGQEYTHVRAGFSMYAGMDLCPDCQVRLNLDDIGITNEEEQKKIIEHSHQLEPYLFED